MKIMVDADEYEGLKADVGKLLGAAWKMAIAMRRLDLLQEAGFEITISPAKPVAKEQSK